MLFCFGDFLNHGEQLKLRREVHRDLLCVTSFLTSAVLRGLKKVIKNNILLKIFSKNTCLWIFVTTTLLYILTRWLIFKGFNGTDDLHYAMLAARLLKGTYDPFQPGDIFSGRILLVATQAAIYKFAGINIISTQAGSMIVLILSCYLTIFKLLPFKNATGTLLASFLFYFNPVVTYLSVGIIGDIYVMLAGITICVLLKCRVFNNNTIKKSLLTGMAIAFIIAVTLLYKETIIVFIPFSCYVAYVYGKRDGRYLILSLLITFLLAVTLYASLYCYFTGDVFFRLNQANNSSYYHRCNYAHLPLKQMLIRLTYGVWQEFAVQGLYPVLFGAFISAIEIYRGRKRTPEQTFYPLLFSALLFISLYCSFSVKSYQPLCSDARQFILMLPLGVIVTTNFVCNKVRVQNNRNLFIFISLVILATCLFSTGNKWQWMIYFLVVVYAILAAVLPRLGPRFTVLALSVIFWLSILEHLFFNNSNWFRDMIKLEKQISSATYYFPEHDNMMHWQLLHRFNDSTIDYFNLEKNPFKIFKLYYTNLDTAAFHPGWLIVNSAYTARSARFLVKMDSLQTAGYFVKKMRTGDMSALLVDTPAKLTFIKSLIWEDEKGY